MAAEEWEYKAVGAHVESFEADKVVPAARTQWIDALNARGKEGWELASERFATGYYQLEGNHWASYSGTMKRRRHQS